MMAFFCSKTTKILQWSLFFDMLQTWPKSTCVPIKFMNKTMQNSERRKEQLLDERKKILVRSPSSPTNKEFSKICMKKVENFSSDQVKVIIIWNDRKVHSLFNEKDKLKHHSWVIYCGICSCGANYIGETIGISEIRWIKHITGKDENSDYV